MLLSDENIFTQYLNNTYLYTTVTVNILKPRYNILQLMSTMFYLVFELWTGKPTMIFYQGWLPNEFKRFTNLKELPAMSTGCMHACIICINSTPVQTISLLVVSNSTYDLHN